MSFSNTDTGDKPSDPYKEANEEDPGLVHKVRDLVEFITACKFGMMTTHHASTLDLVSRCMALAATETGGIDLLFNTNTESGKTDDLTSDHHVNMSFINASGEWASISGTASVITDPSLVEKHYSPILKAWLGDLGDGKHDGSKHDPRIGVIRLKTHTATYSLVSKNIIRRTAEVVHAAVTGKPAHVNRLRVISESDVEEWRATH